MAEQTLAQQLAGFADAVRRDGAPAEVRASTRQRVLDILGLCVAAQRLETSRAVISLVADQGGAPQASALGVAGAVPAAQAALVNGVLAHSLDFDDTHLPSVLHPSAAVVPAALAVAEMVDADADALLDAAAVGLEVACRLGMAGYDLELGNSVFFEHGQHATSICGAMGAAVASGMLLGFSEQQLTDVLGVTASMAAGIIEANRTGGTVKRMHCGWAAHSAVMAAELVRRGISGPPTVLEGRFGFFEAFLRNEADHAAVTDGLGVEWAVPGIFFKPYPANHFTHTSADAGMRFIEQGIRPEDVASIEIGVPSAVVRTIGEPLAVKQAPETGYQAQFSGPYVVVAGMLGEGRGLGLGLADFTDELARDPQRRELMSKVTVVGNEECDAIFPHQFPAVVRLTTTSGEEHVEKVFANLGGPQRPLTDAQLALKFSENCRDLLPDDAIDRIRDLALSLEGTRRVRPLMEAVTAAVPPADPIRQP
ncbi:MmgE/PrpD family protein [Nocardioides sp. zg-579]|uniref:MmgE/PrpD family protein n=1 Tax=Nocardioides marmotae TaxID=2663857 RepID=A0A6I3JAE5_9ACTN|nr:MmgE/PrpD family protein [Nocardioides marmotae]MCR6030509.1 MmgE/PrpD family protein [Gordonia jinghuaiqii]MTB94145.1 MmgE/PrpD family protein [Nocardioides marmotae]QKE00441.1 MmgE/PrpD family protein [Nocardioides marmotae]